MISWRWYAWVLSYWSCLFGVRLIAMTVVTYLMIFTEGRLQDISDVIHSNELVISGCGAFLFWLVLRGRRTQPLVRSVKNLATGLLWGAEASTAVVCAFWLTGYLQLSGVYSSEENMLWIYAGGLTRATSLAFLILVEEWLFRGILQPQATRIWRPALGVTATAVLSTLPKMIQLDLGWRQTVALFLFYAWVGLTVHRGGPVERGAGFLFGLLAVWHFVCGLPLLGLETVLTSFFQVSRATNPWLLGLTGDPLSSPVVVLIVLGAIGFEIGRQKKNLFAKA